MKNINNEIFREYFGYQNPSFSTTDLFEANQAKNDQMVNLLNDMLTDLRNAVSKKEIPENENYNKVIGIVKKSSALINNKKIRESKYTHS